MAYGALTAFLNRECIPPSGYLVTVVLPGGCPLRCPFCIINQRDERSQSQAYTPAHLVELLSAFADAGILGGAAIVGDEPLQDECWPYAETFLQQASDANVPSALITSGYNLAEFASKIVPLHVNRMLVSVDGVGARHDEIRRTPGAFKRIEDGLAAAQAYPGFLDRLSLAAILMPTNLTDIFDIVRFARETAVPRLILSPLLQSSQTSALRVHPKVMEHAWPAILEIMALARAMDVRVFLSDEFGILDEWSEKVKQTGIEIMMPKKKANLIRVDALGRVETLKSMQTGVSTGWRLPEDPTTIRDFVESRFGTAALLKVKAA